jgi:hypothetical protein
LASSSASRNKQKIISPFLRIKQNFVGDWHKMETHCPAHSLLRLAIFSKLSRRLSVRKESGQREQGEVGTVKGVEKGRDGEAREGYRDGGTVEGR